MKIDTAERAWNEWRSICIVHAKTPPVFWNQLPLVIQQYWKILSGESASSKHRFVAYYASLAAKLTDANGALNEKIYDQIRVIAELRKELRKYRRKSTVRRTL